MLAAERDYDLVEACRDGDREAFRALFEAHQDRVYSIALHFFGNRSTAADITQDVFVKLFAVISRFRGESSFETWLYRLTVNCCLDHRRRLRRWLPLLDAVALRLRRPRDDLTQQVEQSQLQDHVRAAVNKLSPPLRIAVVLRYTQGLGYEEIAGVLGISPGTVASRLNRAHKELARRLGPHDLKETGNV